MTDSDFEKYYQKGGTYVLPIEVFNELFGEMENWKEECKQKENIIKEVREILKYHLSNPSGTKNGWHIDIWSSEDINKLNELLEILDKGE